MWYNWGSGSHNFKDSPLVMGATLADKTIWEMLVVKGIPVTFNIRMIIFFFFLQ